MRGMRGRVMGCEVAHGSRRPQTEPQASRRRRGDVERQVGANLRMGLRRRGWWSVRGRVHRYWTFHRSPPLAKPKPLGVFVPTFLKGVALNYAQI